MEIRKVVRIAGVFVLAILCGATRLRTQEHAPTVDVCRADSATWYHVDEQTDYLNQETKHITDGVKNTNALAKISYKELGLRVEQLHDCQYVDSTNRDKYFDMLHFYAEVRSDRYRSFIVRHHLMSQFKVEDAAGVR
jgi:hypothetical protein